MKNDHIRAGEGEFLRKKISQLYVTERVSKRLSVLLSSINMILLLRLA